MSLSQLHLPPQSRRGPWQGLLFTFLGALGIYLALSQSARADFVGNYAVSDFTLTNSAYPASSNGSAVSNNGGLSVVITGGDSGSGLPGSTYWTIEALTSGMVEFDWSYTPSQTGLGCGLNFQGPCDDAGYVLGQSGQTLQQDLSEPGGLTFVDLGSDPNQSSGVTSFAVTAGQIFGFEVDTYNQGLPGTLTISNFSPPDPSPTPEPTMPAVIVLSMCAILLARWRVIRTSRGQGAGV